jgi:hypothetical protein
MLGYRHTDESKRKMSESNKGRMCSEETKKKIANAITGIKRSDEFGRAVSKRQTGKKMSQEHMNKLRLINTGKPNIDVSNIKFVSPNGNILTGVKFLKDFCIEHELDSSHMSKVIRGIRKSHKGWTVCPK